MPKKDVVINANDEEYEEQQIQQHYEHFKTLEAQEQWDKIVEIISYGYEIDPVTRTAHEQDEIMMEGFRRWSNEIYGTYSQKAGRLEGKPNGIIREDKRNTAIELSKAIGRYRGKYAVTVGREIEETKEKLRSGEIPGAECWAGDDKVLMEIASAYVFENSTPIAALHHILKTA